MRLQQVDLLSGIAVQAVKFETFVLK